MNEMNGIVPTYDMAYNNNGYGGMWVFLLFALMCGGFGNWNRGNWGNGYGEALSNEFLYSNLNNTVDRGFNQIANQQFSTQKDIWQTQSGLSMQLAQNGFNAQQCCCDTNRNIDSVKYENAQNTCAITTNNTANTQRILDKLCQMEGNAKDETIANLRMALATANGQLSQQAQSVNLIATLRPTPIPAYNVGNFYGGFGYNNGCCNNGCC